MSDSTTTVFSTLTVTSTRTLTRTILSFSSFSPLSTNSLPLNPKSIAQTPAELSLYPYDISLPLSIIFTVLYSAAAIHHGYLSLYVPTQPETINKHRYTIPLFISSLMSACGYLIRCISGRPSHNADLSLFTASAALILVGPILLCATLYILLTRLITRCLPSAVVSTPTTPRVATNTHPTKSTTRTNLQKFLFLPPTLLGIVFITSDILTFLTQVLGAGVAASNSWLDPELTRGTNIILAGFALQLTTFLVYLLVTHLFCRRVRDSTMAGFNPCIWKVVIAQWIASGFVLARTLFRLIEFAMGADGYAIRHEWCLYAFEAMPIWVALLILGWWHPVKWMQERVLAEAAASAADRVRQVRVGVGRRGGISVVAKSKE